METLRDWVNRTHPNQLRVGHVKKQVDRDSYGLPESHPCYRCIAYENRNPRDCDPCRMNPDKERMKRAGLL